VKHVLGLLFPLFVATSHAAIAAENGLEPRPGALERPTPRFEVRVEKSVPVPMRDGVNLSADLYFPVGVEGSLPVVLLRTPYNKNARSHPMWATFFAQQGYAVVVQDFRGKFESQGRYRFTRGHREDGYDTMAWIVEQPWSSGKIGTYGCSYLGEVQLYQAPAFPPGLTAMIPQAAGSMLGSAGGFFHNATDLGGGAWMLSTGFDWFLNYGSTVYYRPPDFVEPDQWQSIAPLFDLTPEIPEVDYAEILSTLPVVDMLKKAGAPPSDFEEIVRHVGDLTDPFWEQFDYLTDEDQIDAPALFIESWNDWTAEAALYARNMFEETGLSRRTRDNQFIIVSPMQHCRSESATEDMRIGDLEVGDPRFGHLDIYLDWFDHWLRGVDNGITEMPKIQYYLLGKNEWRAADEWPLPETEFAKFYLHSDGDANSHFGSGELSRRPPSDEPADSFVYDPANPVRSAGINDYQGGKPITDQRPVSARRDVLVYTSAPLERGFEMTGPIEVVLFVSSDAPDTDFTAKLVDVYPDGRALNLREGIMRARFRNGRDRPPQLMKGGEVYRVPIRLGAYSSYFEKGNRIRLQVTSSSFPRYNRNLNTGGDNELDTDWGGATNRVHHSEAYPSHVVLPIVPEGS
jgi:putative CocE/NonD family hydrolase